jgi:hypothetical protein
MDGIHIGTHESRKLITPMHAGFQLWDVCDKSLILWISPAAEFCLGVMVVTLTRGKRFSTSVEYVVSRYE